jgi:hypothetical protein
MRKGSQVEFVRGVELLTQREVLELAGRAQDAKAALSKAADTAARKGAVLDEQRAGNRLAAVTDSNRWTI